MMQRETVKPGERLVDLVSAATPAGAAVAVESRPVPPRLGLHKRAWKKWLKVAEIVGTFQMMVSLSVIYWVFIPVMALPFRFFADPLARRKSRGTTWLRRSPESWDVETMKRQG